jgi:hypothetical protein
MPRVVAQALERRDPADVVNYMDDVCRRVSTCDRQAPLDAATWGAVRVVLLRGLQIADIELPPGLRYLPPPFGIHDEPTEDEEQQQAAAPSLSST